MNFADYTQQNENYLENPTEAQQLDEKLVKKFVVRNGKRTWKWTTTRKGKYRVQIDKKTGQPKEVFITAMEKINRKRGQKKAAIKRKAKQKAISRLRKRAFRVRRNQGMHYNTGAGPRKKLSKEEQAALKINHSLIHPDMMKEQFDLICESPWPEILPDFVWDFFAELDPAWLMQLVTLYTFKEMESVAKNRNEMEVLQVTDDELKVITKNLMKDRVFLGLARHDFKNLTDVEQEEFLAVVPDELLQAIGLPELDG